MSMRWLLMVALLGSACAGLQAVERGEWRLVYQYPERRDTEAPVDVISRDRWETETAEGIHRDWQPPPGTTLPMLHLAGQLELSVGEVRAVRVDEAAGAELYADGSAVETFWGPMEKRDEWKVDVGVVVRESTVYVRGRRAGTAKLRLVRGKEANDVVVTVK